MPASQITEGFRVDAVARAGLSGELTFVREAISAIRERLARGEQNTDNLNGSILRLEKGQEAMNEKLDRILERRG